MTTDQQHPLPRPATSMRPIIQTIARLIATDRRPTLLASAGGKVLLANAPAQRLELNQKRLLLTFDWPMVCTQAHRAGSTAVSIAHGSTELEGEVVHMSLGLRDGYLLRLAENDHEASWLRNRSRSATLLRVAHDLRTPIQSLLATAERALDETAQTTAEDRQEARQQLRQSSERALDYISNVLGVIRGDQTLAGIRPDETFNITEELRSLLMMIGPIARQHGVDLKLWLEPHEDIWVHGPVHYVRALFQNIIDNSAKYGGEKVEIGLTCRPLPSPDAGEDTLKITLMVKDLGGGLPPEQKARLSEAIGQTRTLKTPGKAATSRPSAGLNILAHALRQLGGKLDLRDRHSDAGDVIGTAAEVTLTLKRSQKDQPEPLRAANPSGKIEPLSGLSIIVVEDSPSSRDWIDQMLRNAGAEVWAAGNGAEALSLVARPDIRSRLDLILTDMTLPYMSGIELAQKVRQSPDGAWPGPIMGLTAHAAQDLVVACHAAGISTVLEKPIRSSALRQAILDALQVPDRAPDTPTPAPQSRAIEGRNGTGPLNAYIVDDLLSQLGPKGAVSYMNRALEEASGVFSRIQNEGAGSDTGRMLHAATGACTLTGLLAVEKHLRTLETAVEQDHPLDQLFDPLKSALIETRTAIDALT
jgi:CheY-like chemotaxis protein